MATIRLLADVQGMPEYWVVVGEPRSTDALKGAPADRAQATVVGD